MKVLLTHGYFLSEDKEEARIMKPYPPAGLLYISAWLERQEISHEIYDSTFYTYDEFKEYLTRTCPGIIGIYTTLRTKLKVLKIISFIRQNNDLAFTRIVIGGPDARQYAQNYLDHGADVIVPGEGEQVFADLVRFFSERNKEYPELIKGIFFKNREQKITYTGETKLTDLESLPFQSRHLINMNRYLNLWKKHHGYTSMTISSMRGCPYSCSWCSKSVFGNTYRKHNPVLVANEIEMLKKNYNPDRLWFTDDVFTISKKWLRAFNEEVKKRELNVSYECISRTDCIDDETIRLLKNSGCVKIWIGAESGSQRILDLMDRRTDIVRTTQLMKMIKNEGILTGTFIMLGYPGEMKEDIYNTLDFLKKSEPDEFTLTMAYPIKGTKFGKEAEKEILKPFNWSTTSERDIVFRRSYGEQFYRFAIRYIFNAIASKTSTIKSEKWKYSLKSFISKLMMEIYSFAS